MKRRSLAARLAILAGCVLVLAGVWSMAGAGWSGSTGSAAGRWI